MSLDDVLKEVRKLEKSASQYHEESKKMAEDYCSSISSNIEKMVSDQFGKLNIDLNDLQKLIEKSYESMNIMLVKLEEGIVTCGVGLHDKDGSVKGIPESELGKYV